MNHIQREFGVLADEVALETGRCCSLFLFYICHLNFEARDFIAFFCFKTSVIVTGFIKFLFYFSLTCHKNRSCSKIFLWASGMFIKNNLKWKAVKRLSISYSSSYSRKISVSHPACFEGNLVLECVYISLSNFDSRLSCLAFLFINLTFYRFLFVS